MKHEIIQRLLDKMQITAEEAMVLLVTEKEYISYPLYNPYPYNPLITYIT